MRGIANAAFFYCIIAANLTWLLEPLDVTTVVILKRILKNEFTQSLGYPKCQQGQLPTIPIIVKAVRTILQGHAWRRTIAYCGAMATEDVVGDSLKLELCVEAIAHMSRARGRGEEVQL